MTTESLFDDKNSSKYQKKYQKKSRDTQVEALEQIEKYNSTQKHTAEAFGVPRTTLNYWHTRQRRMKKEVDPNLVEFYESPAGLVHLHQTLTAALFVFNKMGESGTPLLQKFLQLSGLSEFTGSSIGSLHNISTEMDANILAYGDSEKDRLLLSMTDKKISAAIDETFFPDRMILVMIEPVSNYILVEEESQKRDAEAWKAASKKALEDLKVEVIQITGDEGSGLTSFALNDLGAHKSPDLFHVLQDISKAMGGHIGRKIKSEQKALKGAREAAEKARSRAKSELEKKDVSFTSPTNRLSKAIAKLEAAEKSEERAQKKLENLEASRATMREEKMKINNACHPFDPETGAKRSVDEVKRLLNSSYDQLERVARAVDCSEKQEKKLQKSQGMIDSLVASIAFFLL